MSRISPYMTYPGISQFRSAHYTLANGVLPGQVVCYILPQPGVPAIDGNFSFVAGGGGTITLPRCHVDRASIRRNTNGQVVQVSIWDRRHWWQFGEVTGRYNIRKADGTFVASTQNSLRNLAELLLDAAGETNIDVASLPDDIYPEVEWDGDNPMTELADLVSAFGFVVCWNPLTDQVHIETDGVGSDIPVDSETISLSLSVDSGSQPEKIAIFGARVLFQCKFELEAVGLDTDGAVKPLADLSYYPTGGFIYQQGTEFEDIAVEFGEEAAALARETVFKWFRIKNVADGTLDVPGYWDNSIVNIENVLPVSYYLATEFVPAANQFPQSDPAYVQGVFLPGGSIDDYGIESIENTDASERLEVPFDLDRHQGVLKFSYPVIKLGETSGQIEPATLYFTTSFEITDKSTHVKERYILETDTGGVPGHGIDVQKREDIRRRIIADYPDDDPANTPTVDDNESEVEEEANLQTVLRIQELQPREGKVVIRRDFYPYVTDGAVKQVSWSFNMRNDERGGAETMAGRYVEWEIGVPLERESIRIAAWRDEERNRRSDRIQRRRTGIRLK